MKEKAVFSRDNVPLHICNFCSHPVRSKKQAKQAAAERALLSVVQFRNPEAAQVLPTYLFNSQPLSLYDYLFYIIQSLFKLRRLLYLRAMFKQESAN